MRTLHGNNREVFKKAVKLSRGLYKHQFNEIFNGKHRIHVPITYDDYTTSDSYKLLNNYLTENGYIIDDYINGYATKPQSKNKIKIGKLIKHNSYLVKKLRDCEYRQKVKMVISRHPYDIACASYNQEWESCLHFETGCNREYLKRSLISNNLLIAYIVTENSNKVMGRCLIIPYYDYTTCDMLLHTAKHSYGLFSKGHINFLQNWLDKNYNDTYIKPKLLSDSILKYTFRFPEELVYDNDDMPQITLYNPRYMTYNTNIRKQLNTGTQLIREYGRMHAHASQLVEPIDNDTILTELNSWLRYHESYGRNDTDYTMHLFFKYWLTDESPPSDHLVPFIYFLDKYKLSINPCDSIQRALLDAKDILGIDKYLKRIDRTIVWDDAKTYITNLVAAKSYKSPIHKRCLAKLA